MIGPLNPLPVGAPIPERIAKAVQPNGGLYLHQWVTEYPAIAYEAGAEVVALCERFTSAELRAIADHMDKVNGEGE